MLHLWLKFKTWYYTHPITQGMIIVILAIWCLFFAFVLLKY